MDKLIPLTNDEWIGQKRANSNFLGAEDIAPNAEPILTIKELLFGSCTLNGGRKEDHYVLSFKEKTTDGILNVKPLIINATNKKTLKALYKVADNEHLLGKQIQLYIVHGVRNPEGGTTDGIRIREIIPESKVVKCENDGCSNPILPAYGMTSEQMANYTRDRYGKALCGECAKKAKEAASNDA